jgi:hypothetical protein
MSMRLSSRFGVMFAKGARLPSTGESDDKLRRERVFMQRLAIIDRATAEERC